MRTTFNTAFTDGLVQVQRAAADLADAQRRVSSGRRVNVPSDDPTAAQSAIVDHGTMTRMDSYTTALDAATSRLSVADSALSDIVNQITAAKTTALGARGSTQTAAQRSALSQELLAIRDSLVNDINTPFRGTYLFSGSQAKVAPYAASGGTFTYQGDTSQVAVDVGSGRAVSIAFDGSAILQGGDSTHLLDVLTDLSANVAAGDNDAIGQGIDALDRAFERATTAQTVVGTSLRFVDDTRPQVDAIHLAAKTRASAAEDADLAKAASDLARSQTALRAALQSLSTVGQLTLMDYLK